MRSRMASWRRWRPSRWASWGCWACWCALRKLNAGKVKGKKVKAYAGADDVVAFSFKRMTVRTPSLYGRKRLKVAVDGEVSKMATPFEFRVLEGRLKLLLAPPQAAAATTDAAA